MPFLVVFKIEITPQVQLLYAHYLSQLSATVPINKHDSYAYHGIHGICV